jgi:hypothetical protein
MKTYDRLTANPPPEQPHQIGHEEGETCGRYLEPDEEQPRGYRPRPCEGVMEEFRYDFQRWAECDTCGEIGD